MAVSGNQLTRIGAFLSGIAKKLIIIAKAEKIATPLATFGVISLINDDGLGVRSNMGSSGLSVESTISTTGVSVWSTMDNTGLGLESGF